jgi:hypothetical protein
MEDRGGLDQLEDVVRGACVGQSEWPARISAAIYAGVDLAIVHPEVLEGFDSEVAGEAKDMAHYDRMITRFTGLLQSQAPVDSRRPGSTDTAPCRGCRGSRRRSPSPRQSGSTRRTSPGSGAARPPPLPRVRRGEELGGTCRRGWVTVWRACVLIGDGRRSPWPAPGPSSRRTSRSPSIP